MTVRDRIGIVVLALLVLWCLAWNYSRTFRVFISPNYIRFEDAETRREGPDGREMPTHIEPQFDFEVDDVTELMLDGERIRLLGIQMPIELEQRRETAAFIKHWLQRCNAIWYTNWSNALQDETGAWIVWAVAGPVHDNRVLNVDLVASGLADVDYAEHRDYEFRKPLYGAYGPYVLWRQMLDDAKARADVKR